MNTQTTSSVAQNVGFTGINAGGVLTVVDVAQGKTHSASPQHANYTKLLEAFKKRDVKEFVKLCDIKQSVKAFSQGKVEIVGNAVMYNGQELHNSLVNRMLDMMQEGYEITYLVKFLEKLMLNPSRRSVEQLYTFLELYFLPITDDGDFLAYKVVRSDFKDKYSGKFDNSVGKVLECARNEVCDDADVGCSTGFHAGSLEYSGPNGYYYSHGDQIIIVKINPADVVSIPKDVSYQKIRTCKYKVVALYQDNFKSQVYKIQDQKYQPLIVQLKENESFAFDYDNEDDDDSYYDDYDDYDGGYNDYPCTEKRYVKVIKIFDTYVHCRCLSPDKSAGQFRNFTLDYITNIRRI